MLVRLSWTGLSPAGLLQKVFNSLHVRWPPFPSFLAQSRFSVPTINVWWQGWGHPNYATEPSFQWVALRSSLNIWNQVDVQLSASGGTASCNVVSFLGTRFPSRKLWINSVLVAFANQGPSATYGSQIQQTHRGLLSEKQLTREVVMKVITAVVILTLVGCVRGSFMERYKMARQVGLQEDSRGQADRGPPWGGRSFHFLQRPERAARLEHGGPFRRTL